MTLTARLINAIRGRPAPKPKTGQLLFPRPEDSIRDYPSAGLTPRKLITILREADDGSLSAAAAFAAFVSAVLASISKVKY
jgi:phage gp29-like protein